jgi:predicted DNA-binding transcriptional regulator AlpA
MMLTPLKIDADRWYTADDVARLVGASEMTIRRWQARGAFPAHVQPGGTRARRYWRGADLLTYFDALPRPRAVVRDAAPIDASR